MTDFQDDNITLTRDEIRKLGAAFQDENFVKLFQEYVEDINSEESRKTYESEIQLLEKDRGYDVKFVHPSPCYVIKFTLEEKKAFINICKNEHAGKPTAEKRNEGVSWKLPVILSKPRSDVDKKGTKCEVYDVMFHPQTLELAQKNQRFKGIVEDTAISIILENFGITLDKKTAKYPKLKYKGKAPPVVLRKKLGSDDSNMSCEPLEEYWKKRVASDLANTNKQVPMPVKIPQYTVKYRDIIDMKDYSTLGYTDKSAPKEIVIEIFLPNVKTAKDVELDVYERKLVLKSCENATHRYNLDLDLSYTVLTNSGTAKFEKSNCKLIVTLPLKDRRIPELDN